MTNITFKRNGEIVLKGSQLVVGTWQKVDFWKEITEMGVKLYHGYDVCGNKFIHFCYKVDMKNGASFDVIYTLKEAKEYAERHLDESMKVASKELKSNK